MHVLQVTIILIFFLFIQLESKIEETNTNVFPIKVQIFFVCFKKSEHFFYAGIFLESSHFGFE